jgi:hypothetical protein
LGHKNTNVPLILKVLEIIFLFGAKHIMGHFLGFFEGAETFLTPKLPLNRPPRKTPQNALLYVLPAKKNNIPDYSKSVIQYTCMYASLAS